MALKRSGEVPVFARFEDLAAARSSEQAASGSRQQWTPDGGQASRVDLGRRALRHPTWAARSNCADRWGRTG